MFKESQVRTTKSCCFERNAKTHSFYCCGTIPNDESDSRTNFLPDAQFLLFYLSVCQLLSMRRQLIFWLCDYEYLCLIIIRYRVQNRCKSLFGISFSPETM